jgi:hypothetical protein
MSEAKKILFANPNSDETRQKMSKAKKIFFADPENLKKVSGPNHHHWKGGRYVGHKGYVFILDGNKYVLKSRKIAEAALGRSLKKDEVVHHVNGNKGDNRNCNLFVCSRAYHAQLHARMNKRAENIIEEAKG